MANVDLSCCTVTEDDTLPDLDTEIFPGAQEDLVSKKSFTGTQFRGTPKNDNEVMKLL